MTIEIKLLGVADAPILEHVAPEVFDDPINVARTGEFLADPRHHLAVAMDDGLVVGFVSAVQYVHPDKSGPDLSINEISVAASHPGSGIGSRLLRSILDLGRRIGCQAAWVLTDRTNAAAMRLYSSVGSPKEPTDHVMFEFRLADHQ
jgi:aminoglycoside 6'-N-acetyltransferase I